MSEKLKTIRFNSPSEIDSVIDELKESDTESYGVIIDPSNDKYPTLFQGYAMLEKKGSINRHIDGVWESQVDETYTIDYDKKILKLTPKQHFFEGEYFESRNTSYTLCVNDCVVLGNKEDIEAYYKIQCAKFEKNK